MAFGQGLGVTMLQMAEAYLCIANQGVRLPLRLVYEPERPVEGKRVFDPDVAAKVMAMLEEVVQEDGTGTRSRIEGVRVAGKPARPRRQVPPEATAGITWPRFSPSFRRTSPAIWSA